MQYKVYIDINSLHSILTKATDAGPVPDSLGHTNTPPVCPIPLSSSLLEVVWPTSVLLSVTHRSTSFLGDTSSALLPS